VLDGVALVAQGPHLGAARGRPGLDQLAHLPADAVALGLQLTAALFAVPLLQGDRLEAGQVHLNASPRQLLADQLGIFAQQSLVEHGLGTRGARQPTGWLRSGLLEPPQQVVRALKIEHHVHQRF